MEDPGGGTSDARGEDPLQRADRNMVELLQELRVAQTGVQILFAFLLSLAFQNRFTVLTGAQRWLYVATLLSSALTAAFLVAPAAVHRVTFRAGAKPQTVDLAQRLFLVGLGLLALTVTASVLLVLDVVVGTAVAVPLACALGVVFAVLWFLLPFPLRRGRSPRR